MATIKEGHPLYKGKITLPTPRAKYNLYEDLFKERSPRIILRIKSGKGGKGGGNNIIRKKKS